MSLLNHGPLTSYMAELLMEQSSLIIVFVGSDFVYKSLIQCPLLSQTFNWNHAITDFTHLTLRHYHRGHHYNYGLWWWYCLCGSICHPCSQTRGGCWVSCVNTFRSRQYGCHCANDFFKCIFLNEKVWISIKISLNLFLGAQLPIFRHWFR